MSKFNSFIKHHKDHKPNAEHLKYHDLISRLLFDELLLMRNQSFIDKHEEQCKEVINYIIEFLIYGDKHDSHIFE
jgi:hypothetical protein